MFGIFSIIAMFRNLSYMVIGAFIALAIYAPDKFDDLRSVLETVTKNAYSYAQENVDLSVLTEQIEESK